MPSVSKNAVFLNIPYDSNFRSLYLAYIVGLTHLGLEPRATLGIPGGSRRLDRILELIKSCRYSIHDLSRVELDRAAPRVPRFNMPFELGLAVTWSQLNPTRHTWFVCEAENRRLLKSLSDLNGTDPNIHDGTVEGVMRELGNAFVRDRAMPTMPRMMNAYRVVSRKAEEIQRDAGGQSLFEARTFNGLCFAARVAADL